MHLILAFQGFQVTGTLTQLGIPDLLGEPSTAAKVAETIQANPDACFRLMRAAAAVGVLQVDPATTGAEDPITGILFSLTPAGEPLKTGTPGSLRSCISMFSMPGHYLPHGLLPKAIKTGKCTTHEALGGDIWSYYKKESKEGLLFSEAMKEFTNLASSAIVNSSYDWTGVHTVVDVGGSQGALLVHVLKKLPEVKGILFDLPETVAAAPPYLASCGVAERVECVGGDFFQAVPRGDCHMLKFIIHDWSPFPRSRL